MAILIVANGEGDSPEKRACGIAVFRRGPAGIEVLLGKPSDEDWWEIPKGRAEEGEIDQETARREVREEVGVRVTCDIEFLGSVERNDVTFVFFAAEQDSDPDVSRVNDEDIQEMEDARYFPLEEAAKLVPQWQREFVEGLADL